MGAAVFFGPTDFLTGVFENPGAFVVFFEFSASVGAFPTTLVESSGVCGVTSNGRGCVVVVFLDDTMATRDILLQQTMHAENTTATRIFVSMPDYNKASIFFDAQVIYSKAWSTF